MRTSDRRELILTLKLERKFSKTKIRLKSLNVILRSRNAFLMIATSELTMRWLMSKMQVRGNVKNCADSMMKNFLQRNENLKRKCTLTMRGTKSCFI